MSSRMCASRVVSRFSIMPAGLLPLRDYTVDQLDLGLGSWPGLPLRYTHHRSAAQPLNTLLSLHSRRGRFL